MSNDEFIYSMWTVMAVQGHMREADEFLRQFKEPIYRIANKLSKKLPPKLPVCYRGILLTPDQIKGKTEYPVEFVSFSELQDVACWFASTDSKMSELVMAQRPDSQGFIIETRPRASDVLFHWRFHHALKIEKFLNQIDFNLMKNDVHTDLRQYLHNIKTQREVILKPTDHQLELIPVKDRCKLSGKTLDQKFWPHWLTNPRSQTFLFCYGSNNPDQLRERLGHSVVALRAVAPNYRRVFRGWSNKWGGGVASLIKKIGHYTYGIAIEVSPSDLKKLDVFEGVNSGNYERKTIPCKIENRNVPAIVYLATSKECNAPSDAYLKAIFKTVSTKWDVDSYHDFYNEE